MKSAKIWSIGFLLTALSLLVFLGGATAAVDPYFHYHKPLEDLEYPIYDERYQNDGIVRHFSYDALITGTSMTQNFKTSQLDTLFDVNSIKVPFAGSTFREIDRNLRRAIRENPDLKMVVRCLDGYMLYEDKDAMRTDAAYPEYLYDDKLLNDVQYLLNKSIFFDSTMYVLDYTKQGMKTTGFDAYSNWSDQYSLGADIVIHTTPWPVIDWAVEIDNRSISEEMEHTLRENIQQNVVAVVEENPQIQFYFYFPPYSIVWWGGIHRNSTLLEQVDCYRIASEMLLPYENVHLFSFCDDYAVITNLDNYKDHIHYSEQISEKILEDMSLGKFLLTEENCRQHWDAVYEYYSTYEYSDYFAKLVKDLGIG